MFLPLVFWNDDLLSKTGKWISHPMKQSEIMLFWDHIQFCKKSTQSERSVSKLHTVIQLERRRGQNLVIIGHYRIKLYCQVTLEMVLSHFCVKGPNHRAIRCSLILNVFLFRPFRNFWTTRVWFYYIFSFFYCKTENKIISWEICHYPVFRTGIEDLNRIKINNGILFSHLKVWSFKLLVFLLTLPKCWCVGELQANERHQYT